MIDVEETVDLTVMSKFSMLSKFSSSRNVADGVEATAAAAAALANLADKHCGGPASLVTGLAIEAPEELAAVRLNPNLFEPLDMVDIVDRPKRLELLVELIVW